MVMKTYLKTVFRMLKENIGRFLANLFIVLISLALSSGLLVLVPECQKSYNRMYHENKVSDLVVTSTDERGFTSEQRKAIEAEKESVFLTAMDLKEKEGIYRIYLLDYDTPINKLTKVDGEYPSETYDFNKPVPVMAEKANRGLEGYKIGDEVKLDLSAFLPEGRKAENASLTLTINGHVTSPLYASTQKERAMTLSSKEEYLHAILYLDMNLLPEYVQVSLFPISVKSIIPVNTAFIRLDENAEYMTPAYEADLKKEKDRLEKKLGGKKKALVLSLKENTSYALFSSYQSKVEKISYVFPLFFLLVSALVNLISMSRLIEEERAKIATYLSLGEPRGRIYFKYFFFAFLSTLLGIIPGLLIGVPLVPGVVKYAYEAVFRMAKMEVSFLYPSIYLVSLLFLLLSLLVSGLTVFFSLRETPSSLSRRKAPKAGKKILLEHIGFLWKPLPFRLKSSIRNIFRHKKNLLLTSLSLLGSTILCMLGFGLLDNSSALKEDILYGNVASSMKSISFVIIVFALLMAVVVIYALTNMNIQEREREIATLKVLGYEDRECSLYTFREIMIISVLSSLLGLPLSYLLMKFVFRYLDFGSVSNVKWYSYLLSFLFVTLTTVVVNLFLYPKVKKIDMNASLKTLE